MDASADLPHFCEYFHNLPFSARLVAYGANGHYNAGAACFRREDYAAAAEHFQRGSDEGDAHSQVRLGMLYNAGSGVAAIGRDLAKAAELWHLAADQGHVIAECNLGAAYQNGDGVPRDCAKGRMYYERAAFNPAFSTADPKKRCPEAQYGLGCIYFQAADYPAALALFEKAAAGGVQSAQWNVGVMYTKGTGTAIDAATAAIYFKMAADQGDPRTRAKAELNMANIYFRGEGVPRDRAKAVEYFKRAADKGNAMAQWNVATLYKHGDGVACNPALAALYFAGAAAQGITCPPEGDLVA